MSLYRTSLNGFRLSHKVDHVSVPLYKTRIDGTGRDSYISSNNGGFTVTQKTSARGATAATNTNQSMNFGRISKLNYLYFFSFF